VLIVNIDGFFALTYLSTILWSWPLGRTWCHHTSLSSALYLKGCPFCPVFLLERESWSQPYHAFFLLPPSLIMPSSVQIGFRDEAMWRKVWPGVVFMQKFWNFKAIPDTEIILTLIQSKLFLKKFKWFLWRGFQKWWKLFVLLLVKNMKWHLVGQKSLRFNLRVTENRSSKHSFNLHE